MNVYVLQEVSGIDLPSGQIPEETFDSSMQSGGHRHKIETEFSWKNSPKKDQRK